jgi:hypothetical protein
VALLPANPGEALWIGGAGGQNHYNVGIGQGSSGGQNHTDFSQAAIADGYTDADKFYLNGDGNPVFRINAGAGRTSENTAHPRSELRELLLNGTSKAEWDGRSGVHYAKGRCRIIDVTSNRPWVCFAQIHGSEGSPVSSDLIRLQTEGSTGATTGLSIVARRSPVNGGEEIRTVLRTGYAVNTWFSWEIRMDGGRCKVLLDGQTVLDVTDLAQIKNYFKAGCYLQDNVEKGATANDWAAVEYERGSFVTWHTGTPSPTPPVFTGGTDSGGGPGGGAGNDTAAPSVPRDGVAVRGVTSLALSWDASTDNVGVDHYNVYRFAGDGTGGGTPTAAEITPRTATIEEVQTSSITPDMSTAQVGDLALLTVAADTTISTPSGWTAAFTQINQSVDYAGFYRFLDGTSADDPTVSAPSATRLSAIVQPFAGVDPDDPLDLAASTTSGSVALSVATPSITTVTDGALAVSGYAIDASNVIYASTVSGSGWAEVAETTGTGRRQGVATKEMAADGATGTCTWTQTGGSLRMVGFTLALRPDGDGGNEGGADLTTAAGKYGWGSPLASSDEFDYTGAPNPAKWSVYDGPGHAGNGVRDPDRVTVSGGKMILTGLAGSANTAGLENVTEQTYGRWEVRCRSFYTSDPTDPGTKSAGYHPVLIVWPTSGDWPDDGEYDFLEDGEPGGPTAGAFMHYPSTDSSDQIDVPNFTVDRREFHNYAFEWTSQHVKGWVDGVPWYSYSGGAGGDRQDIQDMPEGVGTVQLDAFQASGLDASTMELEWYRVYDLSTTGEDPGSGGGTGTAVLGNDTGGAGETLSSADKIIASRFVADESGTLGEGHARIWLSASGSTNSKMLVYADSSTAPGALLAESDQVSISSTSEGVKDYPFSGADRISIVAGTAYWLAVAWGDPGTPSVTYSRGSTTGGRVESTAAYGTPPDPFGTISGTFTGPIDAWCDLVTGGTGGGGVTTSTLGKTDDGGSTTSSSTDKMSASSFVASATGTLVAGYARAWVTSESTETRIAVFADSGGAPGTCLAVSDELVISATSEALRDYTFSGANQVELTSGTTYWIALAWDDPGTGSLTFSRDATASQRVETSTFTYPPTQGGSWGTPSTGFAGPGDVYVDIESGSSAGGWVKIGETTSTSFTNTGLINGATYTYAISAEDAAGNESARSDSFTGTPGDPDLIPPSVPEGVTATAGDGRVTVGWSASTDDDSGMLRYTVYLDGVYFAHVNADEFTARALVVAGLPNGVSRSFTVSATDRSLNESEQSASVSATPGAPSVGGVPLLPRILNRAKVQVEAAFGADLTQDEGLWAWTDITEDVRHDPGITTSLGRADESSTSNPAQMTLTLDNSSGDYSLGGRSRRWPYIRRGTPVRCRIDPGDGSGGRVVLHGSADGWTPGWDLTGRVPTVALSVSGTLRRLGQGSAPIAAVYRRSTAALTTVKAYWPLEEGSFATRGENLRGGGHFTVTGSPDWASDSTLFCSAPLPNLSGAYLNATVNAYSSTGSNQVRWLMVLPDGGLPDGTVIAHISTTGSIHRWDLTYEVGDDGAHSIGLYVYRASDGARVGVAAYTVFGAAFLGGFAGRASLELVQSGGNIAWRFGLVPAAYGESEFFGSGTVASHTVGIADQIEINPHSAQVGLVVGHVTVENAISSAFAESYALNAYEGEFATSASSRLVRLCAENGIPLQRYTGSGTVSSLEQAGPQRSAPLLELLAECEAVDQGQLWDGRSAGLQYTTRRRRERGNVVLTIDASQGELADPFEPVDDDQRTRNRWTVTRANGVTRTEEDVDGPLGTDVVGVYDDSTTINNRTDAMAGQYAHWLVGLGTVPGYRYPSVSVDLAAAPHLAGDVLDVVPGDRIDVVGLDDTLDYFPDDTVSLIVEGIAHEISPRAWRVTYQCSLAEPWLVGAVAAETGDTSDMVLRLDTDGSTLAAAYPIAGVTSLSVASSGALWTTNTDDYPLYLNVGGVKVRATACSGGSSPQTMTIDPLPVPRTAGVSVKLWEPRRIGLG